VAVGRTSANRITGKRLLLRARRIVRQYSFVLKRRACGGYEGCSVEMPLAFGQGRTANECLRSTVESHVTAIAALMRSGREPFGKASRIRRTEQVNVRLTKAERAKLEDESKARGFRGLADFMRATALAALND
jgi:hypothetical protein